MPNIYELRAKAQDLRRAADAAEMEAQAMELGDLGALERSHALTLAKSIYNRCGSDVGEDVQRLVELLDHSPELPVDELDGFLEEPH
jgi:hypothetical protein